MVHLLLDVFGLTVREICLQDFAQQGIYDVTFSSNEVCWNVFEDSKKLDMVDLVRKFEVTPLFMQEEKSDHSRFI